MYSSVMYCCLKLGLFKVRLTTFVHLRFTLLHVVTLHFCTFPVLTVFKKSNVSTGNTQANIDVSLAKRHNNAGCTSPQHVISFENEFNLVKPTGHYMNNQFNIQQLYALPHTAVFMCFVFVLDQQRLAPHTA